MTIRHRCVMGIAVAALVSAPVSAAAAGALVERYAAEQVNSVRVELSFGRVVVVGHDGDDVRIDGAAYGLGASSVHFHAHARGDVLVVRAVAEPWIDWMGGAPNVRIHVAVPHGHAVEVGGPQHPERGEAVRVLARRGPVEIDPALGRVRALAGGPPVATVRRDAGQTSDRPAGCVETACFVEPVSWHAATTTRRDGVAQLPEPGGVASDAAWSR